MSRNTIKNALAASLSAEESSFKSRLAKAEAVFGGPPKASRPHVVATEIPGRATAADSSASANSRVVRDSFTMPEKDYALIEIVKSRCLGQNLLLNKSEVLRAGLQALCEMTDDEIATLVISLERVKTGRPTQS